MHTRHRPHRNRSDTRALTELTATPHHHVPHHCLCPTPLTIGLCTLVCVCTCIYTNMSVYIHMYIYIYIYIFLTCSSTSLASPFAAGEVAQVEAPSHFLLLLRGGARERMCLRVWRNRARSRVAGCHLGVDAMHCQGKNTVTARRLPK